MSLQNVSATAGPPYQPDGTPDQTFSMSGATAPVANAWNTTGNLSADRAVDLGALSIGSTNSRWVAVVFEYTQFTTLDSVVVSSLNLTNPQMDAYLGANLLLNTGAWASSNSGAASIIALECDDGTFAFMKGCLPISALGSATTANNATFRAIGAKFRYPMQLTIDAAGLLALIPNGCDGSFILYDSDGTSVLAQVDVDNDAVLSASTPRYSIMPLPPVTLAANTYYRFVYVPSTTTAATIYHLDVNAAGLMDGFKGGQDMHYTTRDSGGTWTDTTTRRPNFMLQLGSVHDGASSGGAMGARIFTGM